MPYQPGELKAVAYRDGKQVAVDEIHTAGAAARVEADARPRDHRRPMATISRSSRCGSRMRTAIFVPLADNLVQFSVTGAGAIAAVDNGNAATVEPFQADHRKAFSGMALLIVRSQPGKPDAST